MLGLLHGDHSDRLFHRSACVVGSTLVSIPGLNRAEGLASQSNSQVTALVRVVDSCLGGARHRTL